MYKIVDINRNSIGVSFDTIDECMKYLSGCPEGYGYTTPWDTADSVLDLVDEQFSINW